MGAVNKRQHLQAIPIQATRITLALGCTIFLASVTPTFAQQAADAQLFSQAAQANLDRNFPSRTISYLLLNEFGDVVAERWPDAGPENDPRQAVSPGSLVKPFIAIAYGEQHHGVFPVVRCRGTQSRCWRPAGHGSIGLEEAITQSCNAYFLQLASGLDRSRAAQTFAHFGLVGPDQQAADESLVGLGAGWKEPPVALARVFLELSKEQHRETQRRILEGMRGSASRGTARAVDAILGKNAALAKTGTAACSHKPAGAADGFTVVVYPAGQPRLVLLVRVHGITGAESAKTAGAMLRSLQASAP